MGISGGGRVSGRRLAELLGNWRTPDTRQSSTELAAAIRLLVREGQLPAGTQLPAERELAEALRISRTMVTSALDRLREEGAATSRRGSGSWITLPGSTHPVERPASPDLINLAQAAPEAVNELAAAVEAARGQLPEHLAGNGYHQRGLPLLRKRIADRYTARGLATSPDQIVVTNGAHHAFVLVGRMLTGPGDRILVEHPTYPNALDAIRAHNLLPISVAMRPDGWSLPEIDAALRQSAPKLAYLVLDFQNPTGHRMSDEDRERLAAALHRTRTPAVVDETLAEIDLDGDPAQAPAPLAAYSPDQVMMIGSASKSYWGGLRLGWIRASVELADRIVTGRSAYDLGAPLFEQLVLAELLIDPVPILARHCANLALRRDILCDALAENCPQWSFRRPSGGLSVWCELDQPVSTRLAVTGQALGLRLVPGSRFGPHGGLERWLRVPFGLPPAQLRDAAWRLGRLAAAVGAPGAEPDDTPTAVT